MEGTGIRKKMGKTSEAVARGALAVALVATLSPAAALAAPSEAQAQTRQSTLTAASSGSYDLSRIVDGTYSGSATVRDVEDDFSDWTLKVAVTVSNHKITDVKIANTSYGSESKNQKKTNTAAGTIIPKIISNNSTSGVDTVSGATCSSKAIKEAVNNALANAKTTAPVTKAALTSAIKSAQAVEQGNKTDEAYAALQSAVAEAQKVAADEDAAQGQVDAAAAALQKAVADFDASPDAQPAGAFDLSKIANGTYYGSAEVTPARGARYSAYDLTAQVTVRNHQIAKVKLSGAKGKANKYLNRAANGKSGVVAQIVAANSTDGVTPVYGAEAESEAIISAVEDALASA